MMTELAVEIRAVLLEQEIARVLLKWEHHNGRVQRGTADEEDRVAEKLYKRILDALCALRLKGAS